MSERLAGALIVAICIVNGERILDGDGHDKAFARWH